MLSFRKIDISDKAQIKNCLSRSGFRGCEYSFANNMAWHRLYDTKIAFCDGFYISASHRDTVTFTFPSGGNSDTPDEAYMKLFTEFDKYAASYGCPLCISSVTEDQFALFDRLYHGEYSMTTDESGWDYIYNASDLTELKGKRYHGKRNHLKKLPENCIYTPLTTSDHNDCLAFAADSYNAAHGYDDRSQVCEQYAIDAFFRYFTELDLCGGVLRLDGKIAAFTIGERITSDTLDIHIEKALGSTEWAYPAINCFFARENTDGLLYINREEDLGIEGLRRSKRSYHPAFMLKKYTITFPKR